MAAVAAVPDNEEAGALALGAGEKPCPGRHSLAVKERAPIGLGSVISSMMMNDSYRYRDTWAADRPPCAAIFSVWRCRYLAVVAAMVVVADAAS